LDCGGKRQRDAALGLRSAAVSGLFRFGD